MTKQIDMKVLMVCLGNICRSPLAQGILEHLIKKNQLDWEVDSAGTGGWHSGEKPDKRSIAIAHKYGINISNQKARKCNGYDIENFDRIYVMDSSNYNDVIKLCSNEEEKSKVQLIMNEVYPNENRNVPDPYYNDNGFDEVYQMLYKACNEIIKKNA